VLLPSTYSEVQEVRQIERMGTDGLKHVEKILTVFVQCMWMFTEQVILLVCAFEDFHDNFVWYWKSNPGFNLPRVTLQASKSTCLT
jgi:hypothetical protein